LAGSGDEATKPRPRQWPWTALSPNPIVKPGARRPVGHIPPCLPSRAERPPSGPEWLHEIKHDGFRILARRDGAGVRLITRAGNDLSSRFPGSHLSIVLNEHFEEDGAIVFREACKLGCEGIVSKRLGSIYRRGRSPHWIKVKNPKAPAFTREAEEDWGR